MPPFWLGQGHPPRLHRGQRWACRLANKAVQQPGVPVALTVERTTPLAAFLAGFQGQDKLFLCWLMGAHRQQRCLHWLSV